VHGQNSLFSPWLLARSCGLIAVEALAQIGLNVLCCVPRPILQHLASCLTRLRDESSTLFDGVGCLADCIHHESMRADTKFLGRIDCTLLEFFGELE